MIATRSNMRCHHAGRTRMVAYFLDEILSRATVMIPSSILLIWYDHVPYEALDAFGDPSGVRGPKPGCTHDDDIRKGLR